MRLRVSALVERLQGSLFFVPLLMVISSIALAAVSLALDQRLDQSASDLPLVLASTVENARAILTTIAGATITFASVAFSISLLIVQQASSQYSPRVVHTLFRDPFNRRVMGLVVGTFTYCLLVLRSVRTALEGAGDSVVPNVSIALAVALGILTILAIVAFINHSAHAMDVSRILENVENEAISQVRREWTLTPSDDGVPAPISRPVDPAWRIPFERHGWVQEIDARAIVAGLPPGATMWVEAYPGRYAIEGTTLCEVSVRPDDPAITARRIRESVSIGNTRTLQQDASFGLRQLADVALKALSPAVNDPTTAQDAIFHITALLAELLQRDPPARDHTDDEDHRLVLLQQHTHSDLVHLAFDEIRRSASEQPTVSIYLLESLQLLTEVVDAASLGSRRAALEEQAALILAGCQAAQLLPHDLRQVRDAYRKRFSEPGDETSAVHPWGWGN